MTQPDPQTTTPTDPADSTVGEPLAEALVEEVSIDGMCGVY